MGTINESENDPSSYIFVGSKRQSYGNVFLGGNRQNRVCPGVSWTKSGMRCFNGREFWRRFLLE